MHVVHDIDMMYCDISKDTGTPLPPGARGEGGGGVGRGRGRMFINVCKVPEH